MENILDLWNQALAQIEKKLSKPSFETWMKSTKAHSLQGDTLTITAPNEFARDWLESRYLHLIADTIYELTGEELSIKFVIPQNQDVEDFMPKPQVKKAVKEDTSDFPQNMLNPKYTFDTFVIGSGNRFAHSCFPRSSGSTRKSLQPFIYLWGRRLRENALNACDRPLCNRS